ncbi:MAG: hypothetical protein ACLQKH_09380 [Steroidobacteraceae bacterium]
MSRNDDYRAGYLEELAKQVARGFRRDNARKQRIAARSPYIFAAMDAEEYGQASSRELAMRELKELGIDPGDNDPEALLDAHHSGRQFARDRIANAGAGSARDASEADFVDKYTGG